MKTTFTLSEKKIRTTPLALLLALLALPTSLWADNQAYARLSSDNTTLTFLYNEDKQDSDYDIDDFTEGEFGFYVPVWCQDKSVAYSITKVVFDESFASARPTNCSGWFFGMAYLTGIEGMDNLNTSEVTDMRYMFFYCKNLTQIDLSHFDTSKVTDMSEMFYGCSSLTQLDLSHFDTSRVTDMSEIFTDCSGLTQLDLSHFDTKNVTNMTSMFHNCSTLTQLDLSNFNTSKVTSMNDMFGECDELATLNISNFNTSEVTDMQGMFNNCSELTTLDLSNFNTSKVTNMYYMFGWCTSLVDLNIASFNTSQVTNMTCMFYYCTQLTQLNLSNFNTENVQNMHRMFSDCRSLIKLDVSSFNTANVTNMWLLFYNCQSLPELDLYSFDTSASTNCNTMFGNNFLLKKIYVGDKFKITGTSTEMFYKCSSLPDFDASKIDGTMANYTTGYLLKKVGTNGDEILGAKGETLTIESLDLADDKAFELYESCKATEASYTRDMTSTWGTLCLPYSIDATAEGNTCKFYELQSVGKESIWLNEIESGTIEAGTPVLVKRNDEQESISFTATDADLVTAPVTAEGNDRLVGTFSPVVLNGSDNANCYFIAKDKFYKVADFSTGNGVKVNPFRAYLQTTSISCASQLRIDGDTNGINAANIADTLNDSATECYDTNGRHTTGVQRGLNIVRLGNGKTIKVFVK